MNELERTVRMKAPARVVDARPVETLTAPYHRKGELVAEVKRMSASGRAIPVDVRPIWYPEKGVWIQRVKRLRPEPPAWRKPALIALAVLASLGTLLALTWWVLASLAALPLFVLCIAAAGALMALLRSGRTPSVTIVNNNYVKIR